jgi:hypothetical protein
LVLEELLLVGVSIKTTLFVMQVRLARVAAATVKTQIASRRMPHCATVCIVFPPKPSLPLPL